MKIVLISGKQGSGKTSIQKALLARMPGTVAINFADVLYRMHDEVLKVLHQYWPKRDIVKDGPLLQLLGTQWGRETIDQNLWVKCLQKKIEIFKKSPAKPPLLIIGDCRFENEFDGFQDALRVRLYCPERTRKARCSMWRENTAHASETNLDSYYTKDLFDLTLNTETLPIDECVTRILNKLDTNWFKVRKCRPGCH